MKGKDLISNVAGLFGETECEEVIFYPAANRALETINELEPMVAKHIIYHFPLTPIEASDVPKIVRGKHSFAVGDCSCFYIAIRPLVEGNITVTALIDGEPKVTTVKYEDTVSYVCKTGFENEHSTVTVDIEGASYIITSYAFYADKMSDNESDIPLYKARPSYNLELLIPDYIRLAHIPVKLDGSPIYPNKDYEVEGNEFYPLSNGAYEILYERKLQTITYDTYDNDIDIKRELEPLLPLLTGYYYGIGDRSEEALLLFTRYGEMLNMILANVGGSDEERVILK